MAYVYETSIITSRCAAVLAVVTLAGLVRQRALVLEMTAASPEVLVASTLTGWAYSNDAMGHPVYLVWLQRLALIGAPVAGFPFAAAMVHRREEIMRVVAIGQHARDEP